MSNSMSHSVAVRHEPERALTPLHLLFLLSLSLAAIAWGETLIFGSEGLQFQSYLGLMAFYTAASAAFVASRIRKGKLQLFEIPVFITCMAFLQFGLAPLRNFIDPTLIDKHLSGDGGELVQALSYCILGMVAFWIGCEVARRKQGSQMFSGLSKEDTVPASRQAGIMASTVAVYAVAFVTKFYLLKNQLYSYTASMDKYWDNLASAQVLNVLAQFGTFVLVVATIERFRNKSHPLWKAVFVVIFSSEIFWGAISGMKGRLFENFLAVWLVSSLTQRRLNLRWLILPAIGFVLFYPVSIAYRGLVKGRGQQIASVQEAGRAGQTALQAATQEGANEGGLWSAGLMHTVQRLDLLTSVANLIELGPRASMVRGDVQWWMLPIWPFVPRFVWPSKPILDEGARFDIALGGRGTTSTATSYPGDLYLQFGLLGIPIGMFALGLVAQWLTNRLSGPIARQDLFIYACVFLFGFPIEVEAFSLWSGLIKLLVILYVLSWTIYGPRSRISGVSRSIQRE